MYIIQFEKYLFDCWLEYSLLEVFFDLHNCMNISIMDFGEIPILLDMQT